MYARVATFEGDPANIDDAISQVRSEVESGDAPAGPSKVTVVTGLPLFLGGFSSGTSRTLAAVICQCRGPKAGRAK